jgi:hypothetical protein
MLLSVFTIVGCCQRPVCRAPVNQVPGRKMEARRSVGGVCGTQTVVACLELESLQPACPDGGGVSGVVGPGRRSGVGQRHGPEMDGTTDLRFRPATSYPPSECISLATHGVLRLLHGKRCSTSYFDNSVSLLTQLVSTPGLQQPLPLRSA